MFHKQSVVETHNLIMIMMCEATLTTASCDHYKNVWKIVKKTKKNISEPTYHQRSK